MLSELHFRYFFLGFCLRLVCLNIFSFDLLKDTCNWDVKNQEYLVNASSQLRNVQNYVFYTLTFGIRLSHSEFFLAIRQQLSCSIHRDDTILLVDVQEEPTNTLANL